MHRSTMFQMQFVASFSIAFFALATIAIPAAQAQTGHVLHDFTGSPNDGSSPWGLIAVDQAGNVYGSTAFGGHGGNGCDGGCGMVFRAQRRNGNYVYTPLYLFRSGTDGAQPLAGVTLGPDGALYGTTTIGGGTGCGGIGCGTVFKLTPPPTFCRMVLCSWDETVIYSYTGGDGPANFFGGVVVDSGGNIYGSSFSGGSFGSGTVYKLSPGSGNYTATVLYSFTGADDGGEPMGDITMDAAGDIYGTAAFGGAQGGGTVFKLVHNAGGYSFQLLHSFDDNNGGGMPQGSVVLDGAGNLYGATGLGGGIFQITPSGTYTLIDTEIDVQGLQSPINIDSAGNIYGTTYGGGQNDDGSAFKDTYSDGTWTHNVVFSFGGQFGGLPLSDVGLDSSGNMYVTATFGGESQGTLVQVVP